MDLTDSPPAPASRSPLAVLRRYAAAERALCEDAIASYADHVAGGDGWETPSRMHRESYDAGAAVPWWLRPAAAVISRHIISELDYWRRTGQ